MPLPEITEETIRNLDSTSSYWKGMNYYENDRLKILWVEDDKYIAHVQGYELYTVKIWQENEHIKTACTCPYDFGGICKHTVTTMLVITKGKDAERHERESNELRMILDNLPEDRLKEFLFEALLKEQGLRDDFRIFTKGQEETENTVEDYKKEISDLFGSLKEKYYYYRGDYYNREYHSPIDEIVNKFSEAAEKFARQKNYKEAIKIYKAIYESCREALENERFEDFYEDISYEAELALKRLAENIGQLSVPFADKRLYLDYLAECYNSHQDTELFEYVFKESVKNSEEAEYLLNITISVPFEPLLKFNLLLIKGNIDEIISFGEAHCPTHPEMAINLSKIYLAQGLEDKAIETAEKGLKSSKKRIRDLA